MQKHKPLTSINTKLIMDIGMSEGNDTNFYLQKGFPVVGVEADPIAYERLLSRFATEINNERLTVLHHAASATSGTAVEVWRNPSDQGSSGLRKPEHGKQENRHSVSTLAWPELKAIAGVPYYLKMDIEGAGSNFMASMLNETTRPIYASAECQTFQPIELFHQIGYKMLRLINQVKNAQFPVPNPPLEGNYVPSPERFHWSGLFGRELPGRRWFSFEEIKSIHAKLHELWTYETVTLGWIDCHVHDPAPAI